MGTERIATGSLALFVLVAGASTLPARHERLSTLVAAIGIGAVLVLAVALAGRWAAVVPWALALAGGEYASFLVIREGTIDPYAPLYGAGLLLVAELTYWSISRRVPGEGEGIGARRVSLTIAVVLAAGGVSGLVLTMAQLRVNGGLPLELLGVAAAVAALGLVGYLARRTT
jgi:hypothetical protein